MISKILFAFYNYVYDKINNELKKQISNSKDCDIKIGSNFKFDFLKNSFKVNVNTQIEIGDDVHFRNYCNIWVDKNSKLIIGKKVFFNNYCSINSLGGITIGDYSIFGEGVKLFDHNHKITETDDILQSQGCSIGTISIGKNCWIGSNVIILKNVSIGDNVVIGAGNLIYKNIPSIVIKKRTEYIIEERDKSY